MSLKTSIKTFLKGNVQMARKLVAAAYWVKRHLDEVNYFRKAFVAMYNFVGFKHGMEGIRA